MLRIYGVYDNRAEVFVGQLMLLTADAAAIRVFEDSLEDGSRSMLAKHPKDYDLCFLGTFDEESGAIVKAEPDAEVIVTGAAFVALREAGRRVDAEVLSNG